MFLQIGDGENVGEVALVELQDVGDRGEIQIMILQMLAQVVESFEICIETFFLRIRNEDYAIGAFQDQAAAGFVENLTGNCGEMEAGAKAAHGAQIERKKIEEKSAIGFGGKRNHLSLLIRSGMLVDPLQVGGLPAKAGAVVNKLAVNFASGKIYKRHNFLRISGLVLIA